MELSILNEKTFNIYEYLQIKIEKLKDSIAEMFLEGDGYFDEWEAISKLLADINKFLEFLKNKK